MACQELALPALILRNPTVAPQGIVHVYVPREPTVAFSARDLRSPGIGDAVSVARERGFRPVVRSPGGRMIAYDSGAVVIDRVTRTAGLEVPGRQTFACTALANVSVLQRLGVADVRVGKVDGEYCPGEFSVNVAGAVKVVGSAQRIVSGGALLSTVVQVDLTDEVRSTIDAVSAALGYNLRVSSIGGLRQFVPALSPEAVAEAFVQDCRSRHEMPNGQLPEELVEHALTARLDPQSQGPFHVDDWVRATSLPGLRPRFWTRD